MYMRKHILWYCRFGGDWGIEKFTRSRWISIQHQYRDYPGVQ
ncbi:hypothetical protein ACFTRD_07995 [Paenibacillus sp. NPDC056933]